MKWTWPGASDSPASAPNGPCRPAKVFCKVLKVSTKFWISAARLPKSVPKFWPRPLLVEPGCRFARPFWKTLVAYSNCPSPESSTIVEPVKSPVKS